MNYDSPFSILADYFEENKSQNQHKLSFSVVVESPPETQVKYRKRSSIIISDKIVPTNYRSLSCTNLIRHPTH